MAMAISIPRYTIADLERFPDDGNRYELLDGVLIVTPSPSNAHQVIVNRLQFRLTQAVMVSGDAQVVGVVRGPMTRGIRAARRAGSAGAELRVVPRGCHERCGRRQCDSLGRRRSAETRSSLPLGDSRRPRPHGVLRPRNEDLSGCRD